jgi:hypothetical protein
MALISRDPFAREELYYTERDAGGRRTHNGAFCSKGCHDDYHNN